MFTVYDSVGFFLFYPNCLNLNTWGLFLMFTLNWVVFFTLNCFPQIVEF